MSGAAYENVYLKEKVMFCGHESACFVGHLWSDGFCCCLKPAGLLGVIRSKSVLYLE